MRCDREQFEKNNMSSDIVENNCKKQRRIRYERVGWVWVSVLDSSNTLTLKIVQVFFSLVDDAIHTIITKTEQYVRFLIQDENHFNENILFYF
jgi:hypothetical protein